MEFTPIISWLSLDQFKKVERIYRTSDGSTFEGADTVTRTIIPF